jgi:hypothetical protein
METITKYEDIASAAADLFDQNTPTGPILPLMVATLIGVWITRRFLHAIVNDPTITVPYRLTPEILEEDFDRLDFLYTEDFLDSLTLESLNPITPEVLNQLHTELSCGDQILLDAGLDIIVGTESISIEELTFQVLLLYV